MLQVLNTTILANIELGLPTDETDKARIGKHVPEWAGLEQGARLTAAMWRVAQLCGMSKRLVEDPERDHLETGPEGRVLRVQDRYAMSLARALVSDPDIIVLNKPGAALQSLGFVEIINVLAVFASAEGGLFGLDALLECADSDALLAKAERLDAKAQKATAAAGGADGDEIDEADILNALVGKGRRTVFMRTANCEVPNCCNRVLDILPNGSFHAFRAADAPKFYGPGHMMSHYAQRTELAVVWEHQHKSALVRAVTHEAAPSAHTPLEA